MMAEPSFFFSSLMKCLLRPGRRSASTAACLGLCAAFLLGPPYALRAQQAGVAAGLAGSTQSSSSAASQDFSTSATDELDFEGSGQTALQESPDAPAAQKSADGDRAPQTKRILGFIPNFRAISTDEKLPAQTVKDKFVTASEDSFDYSSIFIPALLAGYSLGTNATPEFGHGGVGYGRYLWHATVDQTSENYMVEFIVPVVTREDTRYYTLGRGTFMKRAGYALSRAVITRSDSGKEVFNAGEVIGSGASAGLSTLYYPGRERSFGNTGKQWGLDVGIDGVSFLAKEFWPDINHWLFHGAKPNATNAQ